MLQLIGFDGDDTLWHSETRFHVTPIFFVQMNHVKTLCFIGK